MEETNMVDAVSNPFGELIIDCEEQTGADWYRIVLSASLGGKAMHGMNPTPSCEMLSKVTEEFAGKYATGRIKFDPKERIVPTMGEHITEKAYRNKDFKGIRSGSGAFFAFDQGMWEPSVRKRAREAALLAATIASHTGDKLAACTIVGKITSDIIDEEAVEVATIPVSHLKRDVVTVHKSGHKVFSCGTIQRAITWEDSQLVAEKFPAVAAVDWGRITAVARYIAEANSQVDVKFRNYAAQMGVPYALVQGSYAYVTFGDFIFDKAAFEDIPYVNLEEYNIPSLSKVYNHSADSILRQCYLNLNRLAYAAPAPAATRLLEIIAACKEQIKGRVTKKPRWQETDVLAAPSAHKYTAESAQRVASASATTFNAVKEIGAAKIRASQDMARLARQVVGYDKIDQKQGQHKDRLTQKVLTNDVWIGARALLAGWIKNVNTADMRMARLKRDTFRFSGALEAPFTMNARMLVCARGTITAVAKHAVLTDAPKLPKFDMFTSLRAMQGATQIQAAAVDVYAHMSTFRTGWANRYRDWATAFRELDGPKARELSVFHKMASKAFMKVTPALAIALEARFIDGAKPKTSYLYEAAVALCKKRKIPAPILKRTVYASAIELAEELDEVLAPDIRYVAAEAFVYEKLKWFAADFGAHEAVITEGDEAITQTSYDEARYETLAVGPVRISVEKGVTEDLSSFMDIFSGNSAMKFEASFQAVMASYSSITTANAHARVHGYANFQAAYDAIKGGATYDPESEYTSIAIAALTEKDDEIDDGMILA